MIYIDLHNTESGQYVATLIMPAVPRVNDVIRCSYGDFRVQSESRCWHFFDHGWHCVLAVKPDDPKSIAVQRAENAQGNTGQESAVPPQAANIG